MAIPKGWNLQSLSQDVELRSGQHLLADEWHHEPIGVPYLTGPADFPNGHIVITKYTEHPKVMCSAGDVLITVKGSGCGRLARVSSAACISRQLMAIRPCTWNSDFIFQVLTASSQLLADQASGLIPGLTREQLLNLQFPIPPLPEQKKIAAVLSSVDAAIEKTEAVIAQLQVVKKAMMEQLLTKGLPGRHTRFKQTDLGVIPEDWEVVSLGSVIDGIDAGWSPQCESRPAANGEWGVLKISSVTWGTFDPTENKKLPDHLVPRPNIAVHAGDVLLSRANTPELVGRTVIVEQTYSNLMLSDKLLRLRINRLVAEPRFINLVLGAPLWRELIQDAATGSSGSMKNLSQEKLRALPIPKPATKEQDAIANIISAQDAVVRGEQLALDRLRTLKSALSSSLLSGELRVPTDSVPCPV